MPRSNESNEDHAARMQARKAGLARAAAALTPLRIVEGPPHVYWPGRAADELQRRADAMYAADRAEDYNRGAPERGRC